MKVEEIEKTIRGYVQAPKNAPQLLDFGIGVAQAAHAILEDHEAALATAQAQVAVMRGIVEIVAAVDELLPDALKDKDPIFQGITAGLVRQARDALSAAPKVLWAGEAQVNMYYDLELPNDGNKALSGRSYTKVPIIVLDKGEGE